jgi:hypothetical protein
MVLGVNAVLYYSNDILSHVLPDAAAYVSLGITVVNVIMTLPPIYLIEVWNATHQISYINPFIYFS